MVLVISATYLCRRGDIDGAVYAGIAIFGFIELLVEIALLASVLGKQLWNHTVSHSMRPVHFSRYPDLPPPAGFAQADYRQHVKTPPNRNPLTSPHDKPALRRFSLRCILSR